jgi:NAD-dependent dihydropyrimidine dehydrogenase PreA subunit
MKTRQHQRHNRGSQHAAYCVCAHCGSAVRHVPGIPCNARNCPQCGHATFKSYDEVAADKMLTIEDEEAEDYVMKEISRNTKYPVVQPERCIACGVCMEVCPAGCIKFNQGKAYVIEADCRNCRICVKACPENAFKIQ